jgi:hypothetical protein
MDLPTVNHTIVSAIPPLGHFLLFRKLVVTWSLVWIFLTKDGLTLSSNSSAGVYRFKIFGTENVATCPLYV